MNSEPLRPLVGAHGPFASVYLPSDVEPPAWSVLRAALVAQHADPEMLAALERAMADGTAAGGRALIATREGVLVDSRLAWSPPAPVARVSDLPYLLPLVAKHPIRVPEATLVATGNVDEHATRAPATVDRTMFDQFLFDWARPDGPVVHGLRHCTAALRDGNADALMIGAGALGDRFAWVGGTRRDQVAEMSAALRGLGMPASRQRADEALPMAALAVGAALLVAPDDLPLVDGLGVLLSVP